MELSKFDTKDAANAGFDVILKDPRTLVPFETEDGEYVTVTVLGVDSDVYREATSEIQKRATHRLAAARGDAAKAIDPDITNRENIGRLAKTTIAWQGIFLNDKPLDCTRANCELVYTEYSWIAEQVVAAQEDMGNFLPQ